MRKFIRHPVDVPIEVCIANNIATEDQTFVSDLSAGGLALRSQLDLEPGTIVSIKIPYIQPQFETKAKVVWCRKRQEWLELGVEFLTFDDAFRARMVEQVCYIENYKELAKRNEGRDLTNEEAAAEWISQYAKDFPA
jgi:hypothetical protein